MQIIENLRLVKHSIKVAIFSFCLAKKINLPKEQCRNAFFAGLLHDIGKMKLNQSILNKKGELTKDEFEHIKQHVVLGVELLKKHNVKDEIINIVEQHHERDDGAGYPYGLKESEILIEAKILRYADVYDALTSNRSYRKKYTRKQAKEIMKTEENRASIEMPN